VGRIKSLSHSSSVFVFAFVEKNMPTDNEVTPEVTAEEPVAEPKVPTGFGGADRVEGHKVKPLGWIIGAVLVGLAIAGYFLGWGN
jgi:hypothetical protein